MNNEREAKHLQAVLPPRLPAGYKPLGEQEYLNDPQHVAGLMRLVLPEAKPESDDPELAEIAALLRATAAYAISPTFREELRQQLLQAFMECCKPRGGSNEDLIS